jgi:hypothetical protein
MHHGGLGAAQAGRRMRTIIERGTKAPWCLWCPLVWRHGPPWGTEGRSGLGRITDAFSPLLASSFPVSPRGT